MGNFLALLDHLFDEWPQLAVDLGQCLRFWRFGVADAPHDRHRPLYWQYEVICKDMGDLDTAQREDH